MAEHSQTDAIESPPGIAFWPTGFFSAYLLKMYPIDLAVVTPCHSGQGGTGDVAILTAGTRMSLMPFASIATRIGGGNHGDSDLDRPVAPGLATSPTLSTRRG